VRLRGSITGLSSMMSSEASAAAVGDHLHHQWRLADSWARPGRWVPDARCAMLGVEEVDRRRLTCRWVFSSMRRPALSSIAASSCRPRRCSACP
jgi:hypothetical protein